MTGEAEPRRAAVVGTGLIGGSIGLALRDQGWHVTGRDVVAAHAHSALELGALDQVGHDPFAEVTFVATPASAVSREARAALVGTRLGRAPGGRPAVVTDVAGVKGPVVAGVDHPLFVGGHPMAGSEQEGVEGADPNLFRGATWVLTPTPSTDPLAYTGLRSIISSLGAEVIAIPPQRHDVLVAMVSHVPHLTAATLMGLAAEGAEEHASLLRLAAGGFRDMTRVAAGHPGIWPDICVENRDAIVATLDRLVRSLSHLRNVVASGDRSDLLEVLERARAARANIPTGTGPSDKLMEIRIPVADRPGALAEVTTLAGELGVNIHDLEIAHSWEGDRGVLILVTDATGVEAVREALVAAGMRPSSPRRLG